MLILEALLCLNQSWVPPFRSLIQYVRIRSRCFCLDSMQCASRQCSTSKWTSSRCSLFIIQNSSRWYLDLILVQLASYEYLVCLKEILNQLILCSFARRPSSATSALRESDFSFDTRSGPSRLTYAFALVMLSLEAHLFSQLTSLMI